MGYEHRNGKMPPHVPRISTMNKNVIGTPNEKQELSKITHPAKVGTRTEVHINKFGRSKSYC